MIEYNKLYNSLIEVLLIQLKIYNTRNKSISIPYNTLAFDYMRRGEV